MTEFQIYYDIKDEIWLKIMMGTKYIHEMVLKFLCCNFLHFLLK